MHGPPVQAPGPNIPTRAAPVPHPVSGAPQGGAYKRGGGPPHGGPGGPPKRGR